MNKIFFEGKQIEGVQELREDVENFVILAAGNFPGCSQRKIIFPKTKLKLKKGNKQFLLTGNNFETLSGASAAG